MNRIANEILHIASELLPRIKATFTRNPEKEERDYNSIHFDIQRFVSTLRKNEDMECFVSRRDDDKVIEITVGFTDHEAMKGIVESMEEMLKKLAKKSGVKVSVEIIGKN
jgi:hypothetical protein